MLGGHGSYGCWSQWEIDLSVFPPSAQLSKERMAVCGTEGTASHRPGDRSLQVLCGQCVSRVTHVPTVRDPAFKTAGSLPGWGVPGPQHPHTHNTHKLRVVLPTGLPKEQALAGFVAKRTNVIKANIPTVCDVRLRPERLTRVAPPSLQVTVVISVLLMRKMELREEGCRGGRPGGKGQRLYFSLS